MKRILIAVAFAAAVSGCATTRAVKPDESRLVCKDEPDVPPAPVSDAQAGAYMKELRGSWYDCHSAVEWLRDWFSRLPG